MEIKRLQPSDHEIARWDEFVFAQPGANMFHRGGWSRVIEGSLRRPAHYLYAEEGGEIVGILPLIHVDSPLFGNTLTSTGFFVYGGPLSAHDDVHRALDDEAWRLAVDLGAKSLEYRNARRLRPDWQCKESKHATFRRVIDPDSEINFKAIKRKQRAVLRKSFERDLAFTFDTSLDDFYRIMAVSYRNLGTPIFPKAFFASILAEFGDDADLLSVRKDGQIVSAVLSLYFKSEALPYFGGGLPVARNLGAADFMYWQLIDTARQRGLTSFDFGRSKVGSGSYSFKKNWGFKPLPLFYEFRLAEGSSLPDVSPANPKYKLFINAWRHLPLPVANLLGPHIARHLG